MLLAAVHLIHRPKIELIDHVADDIRQMILRQPLPAGSAAAANQHERIVGIPPTEVVNVLNTVPQESNGPLYVKGVRSIDAIANTQPSHAVLVVPRPVGDCEWVPLRRNPGRMNATIKLMAVQVNNDDLPDHPDKIRVPDVAENVRLELIELAISWTLFGPYAPDRRRPRGNGPARQFNDLGRWKPRQDRMEIA